jgi:hypothetical protein
MALSEYAYDLTRLWRELPHQQRETRPLIGKRSDFCDRPPQLSMVNLCSGVGMNTFTETPALDVRACRRRVRAELAECDSPAWRDALRRAWIHGHCAACGLCPQARAAPSRAKMAP